MVGQVRDPMQQFLFALLCSYYGLYFWYKSIEELKNYLGRDDINPTQELIFTFLCFPYAFYLPIKYGAIIQEAQQRAGIADAQDQGVTFLLHLFLCGFGYKTIQEELNKIWEAGAAGQGAPVAF